MPAHRLGIGMIISAVMGWRLKSKFRFDDLPSYSGEFEWLN
jgi:hypothetical protein